MLTRRKPLVCYKIFEIYNLPVRKTLLIDVFTTLHTFAVLTVGPVAETYRLQQFPFHQGQTAERGSEHTVGGRKYASEVESMKKKWKLSFQTPITYIIPGRGGGKAYVDM